MTNDVALPGTADAEGWRRLHPLSPLLRGGIVFLVLVGVIIANFRDRFVNLFVADRFEWGDEEAMDEAAQAGDIVALFEFLAERGLVLIVLGSVLAVIVLVVGAAWVAWRFATYRVTDEAVEMRRGVVFRAHRRAPLERIQSVNLQRPLFARALGLTKIDVVTAGQGGKVELAYLAHRDAKTVREQILRRAAAQSDPLPTTAPIGYDGAVYAETGDALTERAQDFIDTDLDPHAIATEALVTVPIGRLVASIALSWEAVSFVAVLVVIVVGGAVIEPALILVVIPLLIVMLGVMFGQFNKGFRFTLSRGTDAVRIGSGLTATTTETIPFGRIHAVEARQPLLWRRLGWWKVRVTTAGHSIAQGGQNALQNVVLPVGTQRDVVRIIAALLPGVGDGDADAAALAADLVGPAPDALRSGPRAGWVLWWNRRRASLRIADAGTPAATLRVTRGVLTRSLSIMPIVRAQSVQLHRPLVHRMLGLATLQGHTVLGPVRIEMRGISLDAARETFAGLAAEVLRVQGADAAGESRA